MGFEAQIGESVFEHARRLASLCDLRRGGELGTDELDEDCERRGLAVLVVDPAGILLRANGPARRLWGHQSGDPLGRSLFTELLPGTNSRLFRGLFQRAEDQAEPALYFAYTLVERGRARDLGVLLVRGPGSERWLFFAQQACRRAA